MKPTYNDTQIKNSLLALKHALLHYIIPTKQSCFLSIIDRPQKKKTRWVIELMSHFYALLAAYLHLINKMFSSRYVPLTFQALYFIIYLSFFTRYWSSYLKFKIYLYLLGRYLSVFLYQDSPETKT